MSRWLMWLVGIGWFAVCTAVPGFGGDTGHVMDISEAGMKAVSTALGVECAYCHPQENAVGEPDYKAPSPLKATARYMQVSIVDRFVLQNGKPLTCMTCHQGRARFLPRDSTHVQTTGLAGMPRTDIVNLMKSMQVGLGLKTCDHCHARRRNGRLDPIKPTANKGIARFMMDRFDGELLDKKNGKPATCETCHRAKVRFLPRYP